MIVCQKKTFNCEQAKSPRDKRVQFFCRTSPLVALTTCTMFASIMAWFVCPFSMLLCFTMILSTQLYVDLGSDYLYHSARSQPPTRAFSSSSILTQRASTTLSIRRRCLGSSCCWARSLSSGKGGEQVSLLLLVGLCWEVGGEAGVFAVHALKGQDTIVGSSPAVMLLCSCNRHPSLSLSSMPPIVSDSYI
jgi:hypothetical protein